jgi:MFS transporter, DHA2 family, multidrug resistance protein
MRRSRSPRMNHVDANPEARTQIVSAISGALADPVDTLTGLAGVFHRSGYSEAEIWSRFESIEDLVVAVAEHEGFFLSQPLVRRERPNSLDDVRDILVAFGLVAWREYSTTLVGFVRMMMAEGARNPALKKRVYEAGAEIVTRRLRAILSEANERGILWISDAQICAEQLLGLMREPLYQALMMNPVTSQNETVADRVKASIEGFLHGCASTRSVRNERAI